MSKSFAVDRLHLHNVTWAQETTNPSSGSGSAAAVGSWWMRNGSYPAIPTELYLKGGAGDTSWVKENLLNLNIFNVVAFGAVSDSGVTDNRASFQAAIDAAKAAGGGEVYIPAAANYYGIAKVAGPGHLDVLQINNAHNITFRGDGFASKVRQIGDAGGGETHLFGVTNRSSQIRFTNFYLDVDGITNPDPAQQNHGINIYTSNSDPAGPVSDVEAVEMYFGRTVGDAFRLLGNDPTRTLDNCRVIDSMFDTFNGTTGSRTCVSFQRYARYTQVHSNWIKGATDQQIDNEPTAGAGAEEMSILGNLIDHQNQLTICVTLSGAGGTLPATTSNRNIYSYNTIVNGGAIFGFATGPLILHGNHIQYGAMGGGVPAILFEDVGGSITVSSNVVIDIDVAAPEPALQFTFHGSSAPNEVFVHDNIVDYTNNAVGGSICLSFLDIVSDSVASGNICLVASTQGNNGPISVNAINLTIARSLVVGNLLFNAGTGAATDGVRFATGNTGGHDVTDTMAVYNHFNGGPATSNAMIRWDASGGSTQDGYYGGHGNNGVNVTALSLNVVGSPSQEGPMAPGPKIVFMASPAAPEGNITAPEGSICMNNAGAGGPGRIFNIKESGAGLTGGNTGWIGIGGFDFIMGTLAGSAATAIRFLAPGSLGLAVESTVEIQWAVPRPGTIRNSRLNCVAGTGGGTNTYRLRKNGVNANPTIAITNAATSGTQAVATTVVAGDLISYGVSKSVAPVTPQTNIIIATELI